MIEPNNLKLLDAGQIVLDPYQKETLKALQELRHKLEQYHPNESIFSRITTILSRKSDTENLKGLYIWGRVGRGKTFLMDLFFSSLHVKKKLRLHFHQFMNESHELMKIHSNKRNPLKWVAQEFSEKATVLCIDEFFVNDIGDAMIISGLLHGLFKNKTVLVTTSNIKPRQLYKNGLQRESFLPAIDLLQTHTDIIQLGGETDYRFESMQIEGVYNTPVDEESLGWLEHHYLSLSSEKNDGSWGTIQIGGRTLQTIRHSAKIAWFDFNELCAGPRSTSDYAELAKRFNTILISHVPVLENKDDQARRFINLVDEFYNRNVKLILSAEASPDSLYRGSRLSDEFMRTTSRLTEMQSLEYLEKQHNPN